MVRAIKGFSQCGRSMSSWGESQSARIIFLDFDETTNVSEGAVIRLAAMTKAFREIAWYNWLEEEWSGF